MTASTCATCRHHVRQTRPHALWFEGEQMRTLDEDVVIYVCRAPGGPFHGKEFLDPISCESHALPVRASMSELDARMEAALARLRRRVDREED